MLSKILGQALDQYEVIKNNPLYLYQRVYMHQPIHGICHVNITGCYSTLHPAEDRRKYHSYGDFPTEFKRKMLAVRYASRGKVSMALKMVGFEIVNGLQIHVPQDEIEAIKQIKEWYESNS